LRLVDCVKLRESDEMPGTVVQVDAGRGFIIETIEARYVVTAPHCLDVPPPAHPASYPQERTYADFLGALDGPRNVWAECVFFDPVADLAVFCEPDDQARAGEAEAYCTLTENATPFTIGRLRLPRARRRLQNPRRVVSDALILSLDRQWFSCRIRNGWGRALWIEDAAQLIRSGMSGSPIIPPDGSAVGIVVCVGTEEKPEGGPNPSLFASPWLVREAL
jgi:Trypsin-like peptidase domain